MSQVQALTLDDYGYASCLPKTDYQLRIMSEEVKGTLREALACDDEELFVHNVDWLLGCIYPQLRSEAFAYYKEKGPQLVSLYPPEVVVRLDKELSAFLRRANRLITR